MRRLHILLASVVIATLLLAVESTASAGPPPPKVYGSLWVSPSLQTSYWGTGSQLDYANRQAYARCLSAATDCKPGVWVRNGYAAFAMDPARAWGTGWGHTELEAVQAARTTCQTFGGVACDTILQTYRTAFYSTSASTTVAIPYIPPSLTEALSPTATGSGVGGPEPGSLTR
jgi:hypothetical protein